MRDRCWRVERKHSPTRRDGEHGFALAQHVAENHPWIEIVIASGRVSPGPDDMPDKATFLSKPFTAAMVLAHLGGTLPDGKKPEPLKIPV